MRNSKSRWLVVCALACAAVCPLSGANVGALQTARSASDQACSVNGAATTFASTTPQIFVRFVATGVRAGESLRVEWLNPSQQAAEQVLYEDLPASGSLCLISQLAVAGYAPAAEPGNWTVRVVSGATVLRSAAFQITGDPRTGQARIGAVRRNSTSKDSMELVVEGSGFQPGSVVHIAQFTKAGGWQYVAAGLANDASTTRLVTRVQPLPAGEYVAVLKDPSDRVSNSARFVVATSNSYQLPLAAGVSWRITQSPNGGFSHWGRTAQAYDIAPQGARCVVAMRGGIVHAFDHGYRQTPHLRIFGNYVTIQHDNGEYSHYAHLETGTFVVKTGQRVEQGQALAMAGNSGYSFGTHLHVQVTRSFAISSQSVPFEFEDLPGSSRKLGVVISSNRSPLCDCGKAEKNPVMASVGGAPAAAATAPPARSLGFSRTASVAVADFWNSTIRVRPGARNLDVAVTPLSLAQDVDLYLVSPSGRQYCWYGLTDGYSGQQAQPEEFNIPRPEPGTWRVTVQGTRSGGESIGFRLEANNPLR